MPTNVIQVMILTATLAAGVAAFLLLTVLSRRQRTTVRIPEGFGGSREPSVAAPVLRPLPEPVAEVEIEIEPVVVEVAPAFTPAPEPVAPASAVRRARGNNGGNRFAPAERARGQRTSSSSSE